MSKIPHSSLALLEIFPINSIWKNLKENQEYILGHAYQETYISKDYMNTDTYVYLYRKNESEYYTQEYDAKVLLSPNWKRVK